MSRRYNNRSTSRLSRVQQIQAEEEQMQKQAIRDHNRQAYIARAQRRNQRKVPAWVRERDAQRRADDAKKMEAGEFVIHVGNRRNRSRRNRQSLADRFPKQEETKITSKPSRFAGLESDSDEEDFREDYPQLATPTKKVFTPLGSWVAMASKPAVKVAPEKPVFKTQRPTPVNTATKIHPAVRIASVAPEKDNSAWSDDEDETPLHKDPKMFYADGTMKSWADLCDEESSDDEEW